MKKFLMIFLTAALLTVCLCVPALAADDCEHEWLDGVCSICGDSCPHENWYECYCSDCGYFCNHGLNHPESGYYCSVCDRDVFHSFSSDDNEQSVCSSCGFVCNHNFGYFAYDGYGRHSCVSCGFDVKCTDTDNDFYCDVCGVYSEVLALGGCSHVIEGDTGCVILLYSDSGHHFYCVQDRCLISFSAVFGFDAVHDDSCDCFNLGFGTYPYTLYERGCFSCPYLEAFFSGFSIENIALCYDEIDHYAYCLDCGAYFEMYFLTGEAVPHTDDNCEFCSSGSSVGVEVLGPIPAPSSGILSSITSLVVASIDWLTAFVFCIVSNPLLLCFVILVFVGLGIALVNRVIYL